MQVFFYLRVELGDFLIAGGEMDPGVKRTGTVLSFQLSLQLQGPSPPIHASARAVPADSRVELGPGGLSDQFNATPHWGVAPPGPPSGSFTRLVFGWVLVYDIVAR